MKIKTKQEKEEYQKYFVEKGDPGFSPERNKAVVERTIAKNELLRKKKHQQWLEGFRERADAVETYMSSRIAQGNTPIEKYFGKKWMAYLRGQKIKKVLKSHYNPAIGRQEPKLWLPE